MLDQRLNCMYMYAYFEYRHVRVYHLVNYMRVVHLYVIQASLFIIYMNCVCLVCE